jgi:hypothetical protein
VVRVFLKLFSVTVSETLLPLEEVPVLSDLLLPFQEPESPPSLELLVLLTTVARRRARAATALSPPPPQAPPPFLLSSSQAFKPVEVVEASVSRLVEVLVMPVVMFLTVRLTVLPSLLDSVLDRVPVFSELPEVLEEVLRTVTEVVLLVPVHLVSSPLLLSLALPSSTVLEEVLLLEVLVVTLALTRTHLWSLESFPLALLNNIELSLFRNLYSFSYYLASIPICFLERI